MTKLTSKQRMKMMEDHAKAMLEAPPAPKRENKTSLLYWFPKVVGLGIPVPRTSILCIDAEQIIPVFDGQPMPPEMLGRIYGEAVKFGFPLFLRTDLQSGKHGWKNTCFIPDVSRLERNMLGVVEENMLGACCFGPIFEALVFREFLTLDATFTAFYGDLPINRERRYFVNDEKVVCHHPYWPEHAIEGHTKSEDWKAKLADLNHESGEEVTLLSHYALTVSAALPGCWSVDFAKAANGTWYLIDMALGDESYHWPDCQIREAK